MKILKLLNNNYLSILLIFFFTILSTYAEDKPIDIWNIDKSNIEETKSENNQNNEQIIDKEKLSQKFKIIMLINPTIN